ncbi:uncharacterized protein LOC103971405 [Musa acuminata AAA Group]|uniref:uncharacterized protein LOC103971405 n=1 Tax=Musa acuminata AAA Group TaxID=214697 RepID=UPI0031E19EE1
MARKKTSAAAPLPKQPSSDTLENLKELNRLLLKETMERREQVTALRSSLHQLSHDSSLSSDLERRFTGLVVASRLSEVAAEMAAAEAALVTARERLESVSEEKDALKKALDVAVLERDSAVADLDENKRQAEARVATVVEEADRTKSDLEQRKAYVRSLEDENTTLEEKIKSTEEYLRSASDQLQSIRDEKGEIEINLRQAIQDRDACKKDLDVLSVALQTAQEKVENSQAANIALSEEIAIMQRDFEEDKTKFVKEIAGLKERAHSIDCKKEELEQEKTILETEVAGLRGRVSELGAIVQQRIALEEKLSLAEEALRRTNERLDFVTAETDDVKKALKQAISERDLSQVKLAEEEKLKATARKETERLTKELGFLEKEKERLQLDNEAQKRDHVKELDGLRDTVKKIEEEKDEIHRLRTEQKVEIANLQMEVAKLLSSVSELQELCRTNTECNLQLQAEKESALRDLDLEKAGVDGLRLQIEELKKSKDDAHVEVSEIKASLNCLIAENKNMKLEFDSLDKEKASLEEKLDNTLHVVEEMEAKARTADENFNRVLFLLKDNADVMDGLGEGEENGVGQEIGSERELDAIVMTLKSKAAKTEDMDREIKVLRGAIAVAEKKGGGVWTWLYPTVATCIAAISFAYATKSG